MTKVTCIKCGESGHESEYPFELCATQEEAYDGETVCDDCQIKDKDQAGGSEQ